MDSGAADVTIECSIAHFTGHDRSQTLLLPEFVDDYVGADNPVRFIDAFVDKWGLAAAAFGRALPKPRCAKASSAKTGFATIQVATCSSARPGKHYRQITMANCER